MQEIIDHLIESLTNQSYSQYSHERNSGDDHDEGSNRGTFDGGVIAARRSFNIRSDFVDN
jgi:hypothetical protein